MNRHTFLTGLFLTCSLCTLSAASQIEVGDRLTPKSFPLVDASSVGATLYVAPQEAKVVKTAGKLFCQDVESVTGTSLPLSTSLPQAGRIVLAGTIGRSDLIDRLIAQKKIQGSAIAGRWEAYCIAVVDTPCAGVEQALVVCGSDARGTAYGLMHLSKQIGVSPWYWWADVPVARQAALYISGESLVPSPSVQYRGIFINDEDWGMKPWAAKTFEKDLGDIGPRTYARVCELILRLKGNMLAPAMHSCTGAFYAHEESKIVADSFGIMITTSHCEPLLFNNAAKTEWDSHRDGEWNYKTNKKTILSKMDNRVREAAPYENIYTMAMRGVHDQGLRGDLPLTERVELLKGVIADQRDLLKTHLKKPIDKIPQIFVPYKETMEVYEAGLTIPDDITLVWVDDNYGYMKRLSNPEEQRRSGRSGVYYHLSYLGGPHDYLWLNTTSPVLMYEELHKAYTTGADRYWLLNVGDIKPAELGIQTFFELAWDVKSFDYERINTHQSHFLASIYGQKYQQPLQEILSEYYRLAWSRKPEFMGWEREWDAKRWENLQATDYSFSHYNDAQQRLADYEKISTQTDRLLQKLPRDLQTSFFELIGYPVQAACQMNRKFLLAQLNQELTAQHQLSEANWAAAASRAAYDSIATLTQKYNALAGGKWHGMMDLAPGWCAKYQKMPEVQTHPAVAAKALKIAPLKSRSKLHGCAVVNLKKHTLVNTQECLIRIVDGLGYDNEVLLLGSPDEAVRQADRLSSPHADYTFTTCKTDSVTLHIYSVPFFPLYQGRGTRFGVSIDGQKPTVLDNVFKEYSLTWKNQVLQNGHEHILTLATDPTQKKHKLSLIIGDPGIMIERIVIDWGGLKPSYVGPAADL